MHLSVPGNIPVLRYLLESVQLPATSTRVGSAIAALCRSGRRRAGLPVGRAAGSWCLLVPCQKGSSQRQPIDCAAGQNRPAGREGRDDPRNTLPALIWVLRRVG